MNPVSGRDVLAIFLLGAAIATGNPALADFGIASIILPVLLAALFAVFVGLDDLTTERVIAGMPWLAALYIAFIFLWYEQYKLTGHPGSVELFTTLTDWAGLHGYEKFMRIGVGLCEVAAALLVLTPALQGLGAVGALMLMSGAIFFHLVTPLGVDPYHDGGILFKEACSVWLSSLIVIWWRRGQLELLAERLGQLFPGVFAR